MSKKSSTSTKPNSQKQAGVLPVYTRLLCEIWDDVQPLIGAVTLSAIYDSAVRQVANTHSRIAGIKLSLEGVDQASIRAAFGDADPEDVKRAMGELLRTLLALFESIAGSIILKEIVPKVMRAERDLNPVKQAARKRP